MIHYFVCDNGTRVHVENQPKGYFKGHTYFESKERVEAECIKQMKKEIERLQNLIESVSEFGIDAISF